MHEINGIGYESVSLELIAHPSKMVPVYFKMVASKMQAKDTLWMRKYYHASTVDASDLRYNKRKRMRLGRMEKKISCSEEL